jgi:hypothetical protein
MIPKSEIIIAEYYAPYLEMISEETIAGAMKKNTRQLRKFLEKIPPKKLDFSYAAGKWTIRDVVQHMIDAERVFTYRALRFARRDSTPLAGFDEAPWGAQAEAARRDWDDLQDEFRTLRKATTYLFDSFSEDQLRFTGQANGRPQNAFTLGFLIPGHAAHHMRIIKERYL